MGSAIYLVSSKRKMQYSHNEVAELLEEKYSDLINRDMDRHKDTTLSLFQWLITQAAFHIQGAPLEVLRFLIARTYGYYKQAELVPIRHIQEGVWDSKSNYPICAPAIKNENSVRAALKVLEREGYITRHAVKVNRADVSALIQVHAAKILQQLHTKEDEQMLRQRKKDRANSSLEEIQEEGEIFLNPSKRRAPTMRGGGAPTNVGTEYINKEDIKKIKTLSCSKPRNAVKRVNRTRKDEAEKIEINFKTAEEAINKTVARTTAKREEKARRGSARVSVPLLSEINALWQSVMIDIFGSCPVTYMTGTEYGMLRRIEKVHRLDQSWREFIEWSIRNWRALNREMKENQDYRRTHGKGWSLKELGNWYLGTENPDASAFAKNYVKLLRRYSQYKLAGIVVKDVTAEVVELRSQLKKAKERTRHAEYVAVTKAAVKKLDKELEVAKTKAPPVQVLDWDDPAVLADFNCEELPDWEDA